MHSTLAGLVVKEEKKENPDPIHYLCVLFVSVTFLSFLHLHKLVCYMYTHVFPCTYNVHVCTCVDTHVHSPGQSLLSHLGVEMGERGDMVIPYLVHPRVCGLCVLNNQAVPGPRILANWA